MSAESHRVRTVIVEDEEDESLLLETILVDSREFECIARYDTAEAALRNVPKSTPQLVLMDIRLPGRTGIECTRRLKRALPQISIVMISGLQDLETFEAAIQAGCDGYITKPFEIPQLMVMLHLAVRDHDSASLDAQSKERWDALAEREQEVVRLIAHGWRNKEIAYELQVKQSTVEYLIRNVFATLHVSSRTEAAEYYYRIGGGSDDPSNKCA